VEETPSCAAPSTPFPDHEKLQVVVIVIDRHHHDLFSLLKG
jgi:hypothetical protein